MNLEDLQKKLLAAARTNPPADQVPYAFEKRISALLKSRPEDPLSLWARALWRAAAPCAAVMLVLGIWSFVGQSGNTSSPTDDFEDQFVDTMLVLDQAEETL